MSGPRPRAVLTGMSVITPLGDQVEAVLDALLEGRSGLGPWRAFPPPPGAARVGGDLCGYDVAGRAAALRPALPPEAARRLDRMLRRVPWAAKLALLVAADAARAARWWEGAPAAEEQGVVMAGHNVAMRYVAENHTAFVQEPDYMDALFAVHSLDTNPAACVSELLGARGPLATVGASCASGNLGLRAALDELADGASAVLVVAPPYDYAPSSLESLGRMGATTQALPEHAPTASRPFASGRDGFAPAHGAAAVVVETLESAQRRGVRPLAELLAAELGSDACHRPPRPSPADQARLILTALAQAGVRPEELDLVSAHAAGTPQGDLAEARALALALGEHAARVLVNAPKSMLGHTGWASALIEAVLLVAQMQRSEVHGTANLGEPSPDLGLNLTPRARRPVRTALNNAFGFGGLSCVSVLRRWP